MAGISELKQRLEQAQLATTAANERGYKNWIGMVDREERDQVRLERARAAEQEQYSLNLLRAEEQRQAGTTRQAEAAFAAIEPSADVRNLSPGAKAAGRANLFRQVEGGIVPQQAALNAMQSGPTAQAAAAAAAQAQENIALDIQAKRIQAQTDAQFGPAGRWGSGLTFEQFQGLSGPMQIVRQGLDATNYIIDTFNTFNVGQLRLPTAEAAGIRADLESSAFALIPVIQGMMEPGSKSVIRESERVAFVEFIGDPNSFFTKAFRRDKATLAKMDFINAAMQREAARLTTGLDQRTIDLLVQGAPRNERMYRFSSAPGAIFAEPELDELTIEEQAAIDAGLTSLSENITF